MTHSHDYYNELEKFAAARRNVLQRLARGLSKKRKDTLGVEILTKRKERIGNYAREKESFSEFMKGERKYNDLISKQKKKGEGKLFGNVGQGLINLMKK